MGDTEGTAWLHADPVFASPRRRRDAQEVSGEFVIEEIIGGTGRGPLDEEGAEFQQSSRGHGENGEEDSDDEVDANWEKEGVEPPDHDATNRAAETIARAHGGEGGEGNTGDSSPETLVVVLIDRRDKGALPSERVSSILKPCSWHSTGGVSPEMHDWCPGRRMRTGRNQPLVAVLDATLLTDHAFRKYLF